MFWHPPMSGYLMEPIGDDEDFQGAVRNVQQLPSGLFSKETAVFIYSFKVIGETQVVLDFSHVTVPYETNQRQ